MMVDSTSDVNTDASEKVDSTTDKQTLLAVLQFLRKNNFANAEKSLRDEANCTDALKEESSESVSQALAAYKSEDDPSLYEDHYKSLKAFVESSLDAHKCELNLVLYPVFVHMYLELVYNNHEETAMTFFDKFHLDQEFYYGDYLTQLSSVTKSEHMVGNQLLENFKGSKFTIRMSRDSYNHLKRHLQEKKLNSLLTIIQDHLFIDVFDGAPRSKQQIDATSGATLGESKKDANKVKVLYGLLKEPDINLPIDDEEETEEGDKPKKKKSKKDSLLLKKNKNDPNAPAISRIPLPELRDIDKLEKIKRMREATKRVTLGLDQLPSICFYTFLNAYQGVNCIDVSEDSSLIACGYANSNIRVWTVTQNKLKAIRKANDLELLDKECDDILDQMMDEKTAAESKLLTGHMGPVYGVSFNNDKTWLVSSSEDGTVRLWSLLTWTNVVSYKGHVYPVWGVEFSPYGYYFASCGYDRTLRLWTTESHQPLRMFCGHISDVDTLKFHPNSNYIATGSSDRTVRLWDVLNGACVRIFTGHKDSIYCLEFSPDGRFLASGGLDKMVLLWDIPTGELIGQLKGHSNAIHSLAFSHDGNMLASGGLDCKLYLWDVAKAFEEQDLEGLTTITLTEGVNYELGSFPTKSTPILKLHFTRRNLLLASGPLAV